MDWMKYAERYKCKLKPWSTVPCITSIRDCSVFRFG